MQTIVGIICEYDPFHRGHQRQFELIREKLPDARILCLMSGCFTQRGMPALHSPRDRAQAALAAGADVVLELPCAFAVRDAERFALGGVSILERLGFVTHLSFGMEDEALPLLSAARLLEAPDEAFSRALKAELKRGVSFATAQGRALSSHFPTLAQALQKPNNILALCYLRALIRLRSAIILLPVSRAGCYHDPALPASGYPSATAVRAAFLAGRYEDARAACGYPLPASPVFRPDALDLVLLHTLRQTPARKLAELPLCTEGLENRLLACASEAVTRRELLELLKTKRYAHARLSRLCCHALLNVTQAMLDEHPLPEYVRLLGFRRESASMLTLFRQAAIPLLAKAADGRLTSALLALDMRAYDLWALGAGLPSGLMLRQRIAIVS